MAGRFSIEAVFRAVDRVTTPVSKMQNRIRKFTRSVRSGFIRLNRVVKKFGKAFKRAGVVAIGAAVSLGFALRNVLGAGADFEQAITNVGAVALKTRDQIKPLEKLALELGRTTKFTSTQAANAMEIMARAGFSVNEILTATPAVLDAAAASGLEIAEVAGIVSNALKGMGLETSEAAKVADILALASSRTNSTIGSLGDSLKNVASTARQLNIPIEETVAAIAALQDVGLDASVAGSAFNVMLTKMAAPSVGMTKKMKKLGITFKDAKGNMLPLQDVLQQLSKASKKVGGNFDKVAFLAELVGLRGQKAAANLTRLFETGKLKELTKELKNAEGSARKMAEIRMQTVIGSLTLLASAIDAVKVKIFNLQSGPLKKVIDKIRDWVGVNEDLFASKIGNFLLMIINNLGAIVKWAKRIGIAIGVFIGFSIVLKTMIGIMTLLNLVMAVNPIGLIIIGVVAAIAAFTALVVWIDEISSAFDKLPLLLKIALKPFFVLIEIIKFIKNNFGVITKAVSAVGSFLGAGGASADEDEDDEDDDFIPSRNRARSVISPQERVARSIEEQRTTSTAEVTIRDETNRAEVTKGKLGTGLVLEPTGAF